MKKVIFTIGLFVSCFGFAQQLKTNLYATGSKESEGTLLCNDARVFDKNFSSYSKDEQQRILASTIKDGEWKYWFESGKIRSIEYYKNGVKTSICKTYYENGSLESELNFEGGISTTYFENGAKQSEGKYTASEQPDGIWKSWHENGSLNSVSNFVNGINQGTTKWYDESGKLYLEQEFTDGLIVKQTKY
jgi:hypothetical protein